MAIEMCQRFVEESEKWNSVGKMKLLFFFPLPVEVVSHDVEPVDIRSQLGNQEVVAVERTSREGNTEDKALLVSLELLGIGSIAHLLHEGDKVLRVVDLSTAFVVRWTMEKKNRRRM